MRNTIRHATLGMCLVVAPAFAADGESRIIGGCDSTTDSRPWMVAVGRKGYASQFISHFCGATLIHENWALTAAHCMFDSDDNAVTPGSIELYVGTTTLDSGEATVKPGQGYEALTVGWGRTNAVSSSQGDSYPQELQEVNVTTIDNANCYNNLLDSQLCAGVVAGGKDSCSGDSGGPLLLTSQGDDTLVGVVSYGYGCAQAGQVGVYTSVSAYANWIAATTGDDVPVPTVLSENYSDFTSVCSTPGKQALAPTVTSGGGGAAAYLMLLGLFGFAGRLLKPHTLPKANSTKA
eukprot:maker-scaffold4215_size6397-snap-gene-0.3 protein:Tk10489 transcript:maker-scaffold4215_size6397-snap-gene-0.3-mRNA-1 annotation:"Trypsin"